MGVIWICVISHVCPASWSDRQTHSHLAWHRCPAYRHHWLLLFYTTFTDPDLSWESQGQCKANTIWLHFLAHFSTDQCEIWYGVENKLNILTLFLSEIWWIRGNNCCSTNCQKKFNIGMHSDIYEFIWFKLGLLIDTVNCAFWCYSSTPWQGWRKRKLLHQPSYKLFNQCGRNLV